MAEPKIHQSSSSSSSDSDADEKPSRVSAPKTSTYKPFDREKPVQKVLRGGRYIAKCNIYRLFGRKKPVHKVFGGGKYADVLLWRNKKKSSIVVCGGTMAWIIFERLGYKFIALICHIMILSLSFFFLWSNASSLINKPAPQIPEIRIPNEFVLEAVSVVRTQMDRGLDVARHIATGKDLGNFLKVIIVLWLISVVGSWFNFLTLLYLVFISVHTLPALYEKYEDRVDLVAEKAMIKFRMHYAPLHRRVMSKLSNGLRKEKNL